MAVGHPRRADHGKFPPVQLDIRGNGVEHIGNCNQRNHDDKNIGEQINNKCIVQASCTHCTGLYADVIPTP